MAATPVAVVAKCLGLPDFQGRFGEILMQRHVRTKGMRRACLPTTVQIGALLSPMLAHNGAPPVSEKNKTLFVRK